VGYLDLSAMAEGTIRHVKGSLKFRPDRQTTPANAFAWKVTRDSHGIVAVRALRDKRLVLIAHAKFLTTKLIDREQNGSEPTMHQWHSVEECLRTAMAERANEGADDTVISEPIDPAELTGMTESGPSYSQAIAREVREDKRGPGDKGDDREWRGWNRKKPDGIKVLVGLGVVILASVGVYLGVRHSATRTTSAPVEPTPEPIAEPVPIAAPPPAIDPPPAIPPRPASLAEVMAVTPDLAVDKLAAYPLRWSDVDVASQTTLAKVEKDPTAEQGKHVCTEGQLEKITKAEVAGRTHYTGTLVTKEGDRVAFVVGGATGELVKRDTAKLCGVVTGITDGATAVFGMFDLPENRDPVVEKP